MVNITLRSFPEAGAGHEVRWHYQRLLLETRWPGECPAEAWVQRKAA